MGNNQSYTPKVNLVPIGTNFWNVRASFKFLANLIDVGTHMSVVKLSSGKYLIIDTVPLHEDLKQEFDALVGLIGGGNNIEAVIATHPFHTLAFPAFYKAYPNIPYYGTPRHIRRLTDIPWAGDISKPEILKKWEPDLYMRIPDGAEFIAPQPEDSNHFSSVWVFHPASQTLHVDDTVMYWSNPETILKLGGKKKGMMELHLSLTGPGLLPHADAPEYFKKWAEDVIKDWDFENMVCAHTGNKLGGAKEAFKECLKNSTPAFNQLKKHHTSCGRLHGGMGGQYRGTSTSGNTTGGSVIGGGEDMGEEFKECSKYNVEGTECG